MILRTPIGEGGNPLPVPTGKTLLVLCDRVPKAGEAVEVNLQLADLATRTVTALEAMISVATIPYFVPGARAFDGNFTPETIMEVQKNGAVAVHLTDTNPPEARVFGAVPGTGLSFTAWGDTAQIQSMLEGL